MKEITNKDRAEKARQAVAAYSSEGYSGKFTLDDVLTDLLTDLRHLADEEGLNFSDLNAKAYAHHKEEAKGDE